MRATVRHLENHFSMTRDYQSVRQMLTNRKYIGELRDNKNFVNLLLIVTYSKEYNCNFQKYSYE